VHQQGQNLPLTAISASAQPTDATPAGSWSGNLPVGVKISMALSVV
jgi:hypothetical protein